jgi:hypothetical protein
LSFTEIEKRKKKLKKQIEQFLKRKDEFELEKKKFELEKVQHKNEMLDFQNQRYDMYANPNETTKKYNPSSHNQNFEKSPRHSSHSNLHLSSSSPRHSNQHSSYFPPENNHRDSVLSNLHNIISQSPQYDKNKIMSNVTLRDINIRSRGFIFLTIFFKNFYFIFFFPLVEDEDVSTTENSEDIFRYDSNKITSFLDSVSATPGRPIIQSTNDSYSANSSRKPNPNVKYEKLVTSPSEEENSSDIHKPSIAPFVKKYPAPPSSGYSRHFPLKKDSKKSVKKSIKLKKKKSSSKISTNK